NIIRSHAEVGSDFSFYVVLRLAGRTKRINNIKDIMISTTANRRSRFDEDGGSDVSDEHMAIDSAIYPSQYNSFGDGTDQQQKSKDMDNNNGKGLVNEHDDDDDEEEENSGALFKDSSSS